MNCIIVDDYEASRMILAHLVKQVGYLTVVKICSSPVDAINTLKKENIDILFLDVEMPEMNGMDMLKALDKKPQVIITSSHKKYALDAFENDVVDYLVKPITLPRFVKALAKIKDSSNDQASTRIIL